MSGNARECWPWRHQWHFINAIDVEGHVKFYENMLRREERLKQLKRCAKCGKLKAVRV